MLWRRLPSSRRCLATAAAASLQEPSTSASLGAESHSEKEEREIQNSPRLVFPEEKRLSQCAAEFSLALSETRDAESRRLLAERWLEWKRAREVDADIPSFISASQWLLLLRKPNLLRRLHWLLANENDTKTKQRIAINAMMEATREQNFAARDAMEAERGIYYATYRNNIIYRGNGRENRWLQRSGAVAERLPPDESGTMALDLSALAWTCPQSRNNAILQLGSCLRTNQVSPFPARLIATSTPLDRDWWPSLRAIEKRLAEPYNCSLRFSGDDVVGQGFPRDKIIMLSPDAPEILSGPLERDCLYVIGCMSDKGWRTRIQKGYTYNRARELGIRAARLPLNSAVDWRRGRKSLSPSMSLGILLHLRRHGDWTSAIEANIRGHQLLDEEEHSPMPFSQRNEERLQRLLAAFQDIFHRTSKDDQILEPLAIPKCLNE